VRVLAELTVGFPSRSSSNCRIEGQFSNPTAPPKSNRLL
jgi:hypothetical protein